MVWQQFLLQLVSYYLFNYFWDRQAELSFPIFDFVFGMVAGIFQAYLLKVYNRIRDIKMPLVPTLKELKQNIMQMDEAELEVNYKMAFDIVMNLSGAILPAIYLILFFWSFITQKVEVTGILVAQWFIFILWLKTSKWLKNTTTILEKILWN